MRVPIAAFAAAVAMFFIGYIWWSPVMYLVKPVGEIESQEVITAMDKALSEPGVYKHPGYEQSMDTHEGSVAMLYYVPEMPNMLKLMGIGFAHMLMCSVLASVLVSTLNSKTFIARFGVVFFLGLFVALWADVGNMIWWFHPTGWGVFHIAYDLVSWAAAGAIIAAIIQPVAIETDSK